MREEAPHKLDELAAAVADGHRVDWDSLESSAASGEERAAIRRLRAIAAIGLAHSELTLSESLSESLSVRALLQGVDEDKSTPVTWGLLRILERVGRGRFGDVYRAWDPSLDREVALKLLRRHEAESADRKVIEEGRLMARVRHPNVVTIYGAQRIDGRTGLWMEFVEGRTLEAELSERGPFPADEVARVGIELCRALAAVHEAGLIHRDVKAQNVLRDPHGRVVLGDFGTGRELNDEDRAPALAGTPAYLAPEIFHKTAATKQSDLYSLGVLLFHLATGKYPVVGRSLDDLRSAHENRSRIALAAVRSDLPKQLGRAIERAMAEHPADRFESAGGMERALAQSLKSESGTRRKGTTVLAMLALAVFSSAAGRWLHEEQPRISDSALIASASSRLLQPETRPTVPLPVSSSAVPSERNELAKRTIFGRASAAPTETHTQNQITESATQTVAPRPIGRIASTGRRFFAFVQAGEVMTHAGETGIPRRVTGPEFGDPPGAVDSVRFTFDGSTVIYIRLVSQSGSDETIPEIRAIPTMGGRSRLIWRSEDTRYMHFFQWPGCDRILVGKRAGFDPGEFLVISTATGTVIGRHAAPLGINQYGATLSWDGRYVIYEQPDATGQRDLYLWDAPIGFTTALVVGPEDDWGPILVRSGGSHSRLMYTFRRDQAGKFVTFFHSIIDGKPLRDPEPGMPPDAFNAPALPSEAEQRALAMDSFAAICTQQAQSP